ncbi:MAG: glycosyltransferase family 1 protein [Thermoanaerobaculia bacterium]
MTSPSLPTVGVDLRALVGSPSGVGFMTLALLQRLAARGRARYLGIAHRPTVADKELAEAGIELEHQAAPYGVLWQQLRLPHRLRRGDVDLFWSPLMTLPTRMPIPAVVTIHDLTPLLFPETHRLKVRLSVLPFLRSTLKQARLVAVDSEATARDLRTHFPASTKKLRVVHPGVDPAFRPAPRANIERTRLELGCPQGYLLYAGTLEPRKNLESLLDAWEALRASDADTPPLVMVGPYGWRSRRLLGRIERLARGGLSYLGRLPRERQVEVVQAASIFIYPSLYEGFGLPPAEAMACGLPVIVSNRSSLPEVVGEAGLQIDPESAGDLASAIRRLLQQPTLARELGEKAQARSRRFDWDLSAQQMEEVLFEALG